MRDDLEIIYEREEYIVFKGNDNDYIVYNTNKSFRNGHSHLKSKKRVKEVIENSINKTFPLHWTTYFITTMKRLTTDKRYEERLEELEEVRKSRHNKNGYHNVGGRGV